MLSVLPRFFVGNRRDGARLISSGVLVFTVSITQLAHLWGQVLSAVSFGICLYWSLVYRRLEP